MASAHIQDFENYGHQSSAVFDIAHGVNAHELKRKQIVLKKHGFIPVSIADSASSKPIAGSRLPSGMKRDILSIPALLQIVQTTVT